RGTRFSHIAMPFQEFFNVRTVPHRGCDSLSSCSVACCLYVTALLDNPHAAAARSRPFLLWCRRLAGTLSGPGQSVRTHPIRAVGTVCRPVGCLGPVHGRVGPHGGSSGRPCSCLCRLANSLPGREAGGGGLPALSCLGGLAGRCFLAGRPASTTPDGWPALSTGSDHESDQPQGHHFLSRISSAVCIAPARLHRHADVFAWA